MRAIVMSYVYITCTEFESVIQAPGGGIAPAIVLGTTAESAASFASHVPGMRSTGKSQVAVRTMP
jgi:hypothetical protein